MKSKKRIGFYIECGTTCNQGNTVKIKVEAHSHIENPPEAVEVVRKGETGQVLDVELLVSREALSWFKSFGHYPICTVCCYKMGEDEPYMEDCKFEVVDGVLRNMPIEALN